MDPIEYPITNTIDLHTFAPRDAKAALEAWLEAAHERGFRHLRVIHGKGIGVQREMVRKVLTAVPFVESFQIPPLEAGGWGATLVTLKTDEPVHVETLVTELGERHSELEAVLARMRQLTEGLTAAQATWRPRKAAWSIGQHIDHLVRVDSLYADAIEHATKTNPLPGTPPFKYSFLERWFLRAVEPPPRLRVKAPKTFVPAEEVVLPDLVDRFGAVNARLVELASRAEGLDLKRVRVPSPAFPRWKWSIGIAFAICAAHGRRHLYHIARIRNSGDFPAA